MAAAKMCTPGELVETVRSVSRCCEHTMWSMLGVRQREHEISCCSVTDRAALLSIEERFLISTLPRGEWSRPTRETVPLIHNM
jgi:hypothetical protein